MAKIPALDRPGALLPWWMTAIVTGQTTNARLPLSHLGMLPRGAIMVSLANYLADTASTADTDPGAGNVRWNHATQASASQVFLADEDVDSEDYGALWAGLAAGGHLYLYNPDDLDVWQWWSISSVTDASGYLKLGVTLTGSAGSFVDDDPVVVTIQAPNPAASDAVDVGYDNSGSGLSATNVQDAIDEVKAGAGGGGGGGRGYGAAILRNPAAKFPLFQGCNSNTLGAASLPANTICAFPFTVDRAVTLASLGGRTNGSGAGKFRVGVYANAFSGGRDMPGNLIGQTGNLSMTGADTAGSPSPAVALSPNTIYWALVANSSGSIGMTTAGQADVVPGMLGCEAFSTGAITHLRSTLSGGWTSLPADATTLTWTNQSANGYAAFGVE